jgi:lipid II:glycine glycyltransferase (peptidoglycan interpeptide bridge formation enzyme)
MFGSWRGIKYHKGDNVQSEIWNSLVLSQAGAHILQTWQWGEIKGGIGWRPHYFAWPAESAVIDFSDTDDSSNRISYSGSDIQAAAMLLKRSVTIPGINLGSSIFYSPKGPLLDWNNRELRRRVLANMTDIARQHKAIFIKIDPDVNLGYGYPEDTYYSEDGNSLMVVQDLIAGGWRPSDEQVQFRNTVELDLRQPENVILSRMKQKARYNLRLAARKGVTIRVGTIDDIPMLYRMYAETSIRDHFVIRDEAYYHTLWESFTQAGFADPLIAEVDGEPVAGLILFYFGQRAWYMYGMSKQVHREKMPNYLLQWEAIRRAKAKNCLTYDLWGAPDELIQNDPLWGVYRFKEGLGGQVVRRIGAWDWPVNPLLYRLYTQILPRILMILRRRGLSTTRQSVGISE